MDYLTTTQILNGVAGGCGGLLRTLNKVVNDVPERGGGMELLKNIQPKLIVYNVGTGAAAGAMLGTSILDAFGLGFTGNYVLTKVLTALWDVVQSKK